MMSYLKRSVINAQATVVLFVFSVQAYASVTVTQNLGGSWVGSPTVMTASSPLTSKEGNWGSSAPYSLGQSFTAPVSGVLTNIQLYGSGRTSANILLYLYDMGPAIQYASQPSSVISGSNSVTTVVGGNLFSTNLAITMTASGNDSVMQLTFSGADVVQLIGGHEYMFTMVSTNSSPMYWDDGGGNPYPGGAAYRQNSFINGGATTDFSLAVTLVNTNAGPTIYDSVVDWNTVHQRIDGFGASSAWRSTWTTAQADMFFSTNSGTGTTIVGTTNFPYTGIGLSFLRSRVNTNGTGTYENSIMQMAQARGARVWSAPWSPPPQFKSNGNVNGGNFLSASNQAYANLLAQYVVNMTNSYGVGIYALSVQNEPDVSTSYESCLWTDQQIHDFVPYLRNALNAAGKSSVKIIAAEDEHWETNLYDTAMMDAAVATNVNIVACHNYDGSPPNNTPVALPTYANTNAVLWETEVSKLAGNGAFDPSMTDAIYWAGRIHQFMTMAQVSAWHYWWLISNNTDNEGLTDVNGNPAKRMYVLGQYSRFVRPDNYRIDLANYNPYAVLGSAYKDTVSGNFAIVIANTNSADTTQSFYFTNFTATTVTPWITSSNLSLAAQSPVTVTSSTFSYVIPGMSVVTFVGTALPNGPVTPVLTPVPNQTVNPGVTLLVTNVAVDANVPPLALSFSLSGPTNATLTTLTATSSLFSWTPLSSQANTTNLITVIVTDNSMPPQSATNSFTVVVNPVVGVVPTATALSSSTNNATYGTQVTFTAAVTPAPTNGETVAFMIGGSAIGTGVLNGGVASFTTTGTALAAAGSPYAVTAAYGGDGYYQNSTSSAVSQTVTPTPVTIASGLAASNKVYDGTTTATITSNNVSLSGVVSGDVGLVSLSTNGSTAFFASKNAGNGNAVTVSGLVLSGTATGNYYLTPPALSANITPLPVTLATSSGSLRITNNFSSANNQFEVYNGLNGFSPALNGALYTNFQCDVRFAPGSATQTNTAGVLIFGHLQFGTRTNYNQDYFGGATYGIDIPATNTGWVHISIPISVTADPNLASINDVLIHIYGPSYTPTLNGPSTLWVDNMAFVGPGNQYIVDQFNPAGVGGNSYSGGNIGSVWGNWFGASWVANTWDSTNDALGVAANNKTFDGTTNATITLYDPLIDPALSGILSADSTNVWLATNGYTASFASTGPGTNLTVTVSGLTLAGSAGGNYTVVPLNLSANISQGSQQPTLISIAPTASAITYGQTLVSSILSGGAATNAAGVAVGGSFTFTDPATAPGAGTPTESVTFTPTDTVNYFAATTTVTVLVNPQTPIISILPTASAISYGQTLANSSLNGGAATNTAGVVVNGSFDFTTLSTMPGAGAPGEPVTFTPSDGVNYFAASVSVPVTVSPVTITVTADNQSKTAGLPNPALTATYSGFVNGEDTNALTTLAGLNTPADTSSPAGGYPITPGGAAAPNYTFNYVPGTLTVVAQPQMMGVNAGASGFALTFPTLPGQTYQLVGKTNLTDAAWMPVGDPVPGTGGSVSITNNSGAAQGFYMLQIWQP